MKHLRRSILLVVATATMLLVSAGVAIAAEYPPEPGPTPGGSSVSTTAGGGNLAFTGSDMTLFWVALVVLVTGFVLVLATRRRAATRRRMALGEARS